MSDRRDTLAVERRSIDFIPEDERHGDPKGLFFVWFAANMQITPLVTGALGPVLGLSLPWSLLAIVVGNAFGTVFMALHSAQGPKLGIPQMIQSRAQFGFYGAILPILLVILMYVGFFAASGVLGGDALASWTGIGPTAGIVAVSAICVVITVYGYRMIHGLERFSSVISGAGFVYLTVRLLTGNDLSRVWHAGAFTFGPFLLMVAIAATWQIAYAPYVADYSRYLPTKTSIQSCFWWTYAGSAIGTVWMMAFGAAAASVAAKAFDQGSTAFVVDLAPPGARWAFAAVVILGVVAVNVLNLYGAFMSFTTTATAVKPFEVRAGARLTVVVGTAAVGTVLAVVGRTSFITTYEDFILFLTYFLIPWTAVNLVDFYFVRKERYDIPAIFTPRGRYGAVSGRAMLAYLLGVAVEVPFMSTSFYTGPLVASLSGADISWILGLIVSSAVYYALMRGHAEQAVAPPAEQPASTTTT